MEEYYLSVERVYSVEAKNRENAIAKTHDKITEEGIRSEDLKIVDVVDK